MLNFKASFIASTLAVASIGALAQTPATPRADQREANQQARIANGAASGQLTSRETSRLETQQAVVNRAEDRAKADGSVTRHERKRLHRMQHSTSKRIHRQKHDAQTAR